MWCIPPEKNAEFVCCMENVLETYQQPYSADEPVVCMDEVSVQLIGETRQEIPMTQGDPVRYDYAYERKGTANIFMVCEPLKGFRQVTVTERRTPMPYSIGTRSSKIEWSERLPCASNISV